MRSSGVFLTDIDWLRHDEATMAAELAATAVLDGRAGTVSSSSFLHRWRAWRKVVPVCGIRFVDFFCGAGGEAQGLVAAGLTPVLAANHWEWAIRSHQANHPDTDHFQGDLQQPGIVESLPFAEFFWASPSCPAWTKANGEPRTFDQQPSLFSLEEFADEEREMYGEVSDDERERSRALMWDVPRYLDAMQQREGRPVLAGVVENVIDCRAWFRWDEWVRSFHNLGYRTRLVAFNSMHADAPRSERAPQTRDRLYLTYWHRSLGRDPDFDKWLRPVADCDRHATIAALQSWKRPGADMGRYRSQYTYRCPQITCRNQVVEPVVEPAAAAIDFTLPSQRIGDRARPLAEQTYARIVAGRRIYWSTGARAALLVPTEGRAGKAASPATGSLRTQTTRNATALVLPPLVVSLRNHGKARPADVDPLQTFSADGFHHALFAYDTGTVRALTEPLPAQTTVVGDAVLGGDGEVAIEDCTLRMLEPAEIGRGMAFGTDYVVLGNKRIQARQYGNAVTPPVAELLGLAMREAITGEQLDRNPSTTPRAAALGLEKAPGASGRNAETVGGIAYGANHRNGA